MKKKHQYKKYAKMFLNHAGANHGFEALEQFGAVRALVESNREIRGFFAGPQFTAEEKKAALGHLDGKVKLSGPVLKFLNYLIDADAMDGLDEIMSAAVALYLERHRKAEAVVAAPVELDKGMLERLKAALGRITGKDVDIKYVKDPSVLGGVLVKVGSMMFDGSVRGQLRLLKEELIKG
ncbi:MAG: ATP synthase F1 subunit delta [Nitrospiraceae bacterium]|nr:ATP synthase F1 subunit delta [Nitrospiraceae bacterium]